MAVPGPQPPRSLGKQPSAACSFQSQVRPGSPWGGQNLGPTCAASSNQLGPDAAAGAAEGKAGANPGSEGPRRPLGRPWELDRELGGRLRARAWWARQPALGCRGSWFPPEHRVCWACPHQKTHVCLLGHKSPQTSVCSFTHLFPGDLSLPPTLSITSELLGFLSEHSSQSSPAGPGPQATPFTAFGPSDDCPRGSAGPGDGPGPGARQGNQCPRGAPRQGQAGWRQE